MSRPSVKNATICAASNASKHGRRKRILVQAVDVNLKSINKSIDL